MRWYVHASLDGWTLDPMGPLTIEQACLVARCVYRDGIFNKAVISVRRAIL